MTPRRTPKGSVLLSRLLSGRRTQVGVHDIDAQDVDPQHEDRSAWQQMDTGWVMSIELLTATFLYGGIGWLLDRWLHTAPWLLSFGFLLGFATGFYLIWARTEGRIGTARTITPGTDATPATDRGTTDED